MPFTDYQVRQKLTIAELLKNDLFCIIIGEELAQLFRDAPTTELPLSMLSTDEGGLTAARLAIKIGAANSQCKHFLTSNIMINNILIVGYYSFC